MIAVIFFVLLAKVIEIRERRSNRVTILNESVEKEKASSALPKETGHPSIAMETDQEELRAESPNLMPDDQKRRLS